MSSTTRCCNAFAVVGDPATVGRGISERFGSLMTRVNFYAPYEHDPSIWPELLCAARETSTKETE